MITGSFRESLIDEPMNALMHAFEIISFATQSRLFLQLPLLEKSRGWFQNWSNSAYGTHRNNIYIYIVIIVDYTHNMTRFSHRISKGIHNKHKWIVLFDKHKWFVVKQTNGKKSKNGQSGNERQRKVIDAKWAQKMWNAIWMYIAKHE